MGIPQVADLVLESANAPGTGAFILGGAPDGRQTFADAFPAGGEVYYYASDGTQTEWGIGTLTLGSPNTLARTTVLGNLFGSKNALNFTASITVWSEIPAQRTQSLDDAGMLPVSGNPDFTRDVALSAKVADGRYGAMGKVLQRANAAVQEVTGPVTFSGITMVATPTDYTQKQAIGASDADGRYVRLSGGNTLSGDQVVNGNVHVVGRRLVLINPTGGQCSLYTDWQGGGLSSNDLVIETGTDDAPCYTTVGDTGRIFSTVKGDVAFTSQIPTAGTITGGYYKKIPISGGGFLLTQMFEVTVSDTGRVSFPLAYSSPPAPPQLSMALNRDVDLGSSSVDATGFTAMVVASGSFPISVYVEGIVSE
ncbi:hypothetical protein [Acetobacter okinawensis]|uniref:hypothetical protein n=1 Tax=Acetobacter okinawensis TaxID=1076594 RepID=UPI000A37C0A4|nr:hypothetical protein [Acetobacter okinawensis]